jgi:hypothetical protein
MSSSGIYPRVESLQDFYGSQEDRAFVVPQYQRDYAWRAKTEVRQLLEDIMEFLQDDDAHEYLLGQVIVSNSRIDDSLELIDGQQRSSTLYLLAVWLYSQLRRRKTMIQSQDSVLEGEISRTLIDLQWILTSSKSADRATWTPRLSLAHNAGDEYLIPLVTETARKKGRKADTPRRLEQAYAEIETTLSKHYEVCHSGMVVDDAVAAFLADVRKLMNGMVIVNLLVPTIVEALDLFEKINNRGKGLSGADLTKNLLFQLVPEEDFSEVTNLWKTTQNELADISIGRVGDMTYLLRSIAWTRSNGERVGNKKVYEFWERRICDSVQAQEFAKELPAWASTLRALTKLKAPWDPAIQLDALRIPAHFSFIQHYPILLAGKHLPAPAFEELTDIVSKRVLLSQLAQEKPQEFDRAVVKWCAALAGCTAQTPQEVVGISRAVIGDDMQTLLQRAKQLVVSLDYVKDSAAQRAYLAYLSRYTQHLAGEHDHGYSNYLEGSQNGKKGYDIEHIWPKSDPGVASRNSIGNLVLAHPEQRTDRTASPHEKAATYANTPIHLPRSLCAPVDLAKVSNRLRAVYDRVNKIAPPSLETWGEAAIEKRATLYHALFTESLEPLLGKGDVPDLLPAATPHVAIGESAIFTQAKLDPTGMDQIVHAARAQLLQNVNVSLDNLCATYAPEVKNCSAYKSVTSHVVARILETGATNLLTLLSAHGVQVRTCRVWSDTGKLREALSLPAFKPTEVIKKPWASAYEIVPRWPILLVVFEHSRSRSSLCDAVLSEVKLWVPSAEEVHIMETEYEAYRHQLTTSPDTATLSQSSTTILHVRPHGSDASDRHVLESGVELMKSSFYINQSYLLEILKR